MLTREVPVTARPESKTFAVLHGVAITLLLLGLVGTNTFVCYMIGHDSGYEDGRAIGERWGHRLGLEEGVERCPEELRWNSGWWQDDEIR